MSLWSIFPGSHRPICGRSTREWWRYSMIPTPRHFPWDSSGYEGFEPGSARRQTSATLNSNKSNPRAEDPPTARSRAPSRTHIQPSFSDSTPEPAPCNDHSRPLATDNSTFKATATKRKKRRRSDATEGDESQPGNKRARKAAAPPVKLRRSARLRCKR